MIVSFIIPTRRRLQSLLESIESIKKNASPDVQVEILVKIDDDDYETLVGKDRIQGDITIGPRWGGNHSVYIFANELAAKSHGDWIVGWNDDLFMVTHNWDKFLPQIDPKNCAFLTWFQRGSYTFEFPVMTRKLYELWECFAPGPSADFMLHKIWVNAGKPIPEQPIKVNCEHRRSQANCELLWIRPEEATPAPVNSFSIIDMERMTKILRNTPLC